MHDRFIRNRFTWPAHLLMAFYSCFINVIGPITPFLKDETGSSHTFVSLHSRILVMISIILAMAIAVTRGNTVQAGARVTLASGAAIFAFPLLLCRLADAVGFQPAYCLVGVLLVFSPAPATATGWISSAKRTSAP